MDVRLSRRRHRQYRVPLMKLSTAILGGLFFGGFGVFSAAWTVLFVLRGEVLNAFVTLGVSAFCFGLIIPMFAVVPGNVAPRVDVDDAGTTFRPDRAVDLPIQIGFGLAVIASAIYTIFAPAGMVTIPVPAAMRYSLPFTSGVLLLIAAPRVAKPAARLHEVSASDTRRIRSGGGLAVRVRRLASGEGRDRSDSWRKEVHVGSHSVRDVRRQHADDCGRWDDAGRHGIARTDPVLLGASRIAR